MHIKKTTRQHGGPAKAEFLVEWGEYENSWAYLMLFIVAAVVFPQKF